MHKLTHMFQNFLKYWIGPRARIFRLISTMYTVYEKQCWFFCSVWFFFIWLGEKANEWWATAGQMFSWKFKIVRRGQKYTCAVKMYVYIKSHTMVDANRGGIGTREEGQCWSVWNDQEPPILQHRRKGGSRVELLYKHCVPRTDPLWRQCKWRGISCSGWWQSLKRKHSPELMVEFNFSMPLFSPTFSMQRFYSEFILWSMKTGKNCNSHIMELNHSHLTRACISERERERERER